MSIMKLFSSKHKQPSKSPKTVDVHTLLPIGSVVRLKEGEKRLMITGVMQETPERPNQQFDYVGVFYPEGHLGEDNMFLFDHKDIEQVYFRGYEDEEREKFLREVACDTLGE